MAGLKALRQPDLVLITWTRIPLVPGSARRIIAVRVIGSAEPCKATLVTNGLLITALNCLLDDFKNRLQEEKIKCERLFVAAAFLEY
ncbi:hypothetical protein FHS15_000136 [Paenibacillus castaneae]|uniref:hypothetical protein n=1 Tax=Paenibacillus castaneae TaxID=474957 RepID=UPI001ABBCE34|nr:hypothetical protein [Paenibacillus castaneae]NIK75038.1 hypothetical protein [Paenibacillus castaneae]